ncbi:related to carbonyl reductase [Sporisorium reilianum f. sp. reilianum]|uniref:Related to carbonyl reductase n=1 Tax=Sporisorium reilianum f. sp. reilianum TaxID=72559 RepID=A0A2N8UAZ7_9BASI|nr:related to carbonyl reductase [Sporisorium reilianum f. sp. reilianum]
MVTALISGGNRGLGYGIVRRLANEFPSSPISTSASDKLTIYLGSRDINKGEAAKQSIYAELAKEVQERVSIQVRQLDTASHDSIVRLGKELHSGGVDILVNNAGIMLEEFDVAGNTLAGFSGDNAKRTVATNYYGVKDVIDHIRVNDGGRIVNIASHTGMLKGFGHSVRQRFLEAQAVEDVDALMQEFQESIADGTWKEKGWKDKAFGIYASSKSALIAYTRALANEYAKQGRNVHVVSCCPGYVNTDMTRGHGSKTLDQGAKTPVLLALSKVDAKPGEFWSEGKRFDWESKFE